MTDDIKQYRRMTESPLVPLVMAMALPTILTTMITAIYNLTDTFFVSQLSTAASGAVGIVFAIQSLIQAVGFGIGMGASSLVSRALGEKNTERASVFASSALAFSVLFGLIVAAVCLPLLDGVVTLFGANEEILPYARDYAFYILAGAPVMCAMFVLNILLRACGKTGLCLIGVTSGAIVNMILDPFFILDEYLGLHTAGAAMATVIGQIVSLFVFIGFHIAGKCVAKIKFRYISLRPKVYGEILRDGAPTILRQGVACLSATVLNNITKPFGTEAIAAITIANKLYQLMRSILLGIGQGFQPVAGYNYGAKRYDRVKKGFWVTTVIGTLLAVGFTAVLGLWSSPLMMFFRADDAQVIAYGAHVLRLFCFSMPFLAYSTYVNMTLQCLGKSVRASLLAMCRNGFLYIPLLFVLPDLFGFTGIAVTQPLADLLTAAVSVPFQVLFFVQLTKEEKKILS